MVLPKFKIYEGIVCLEVASKGGGKWWDQGYGLGYTPFKIDDIRRIKSGTLQGTGRMVLAALVDLRGSGEEWVAINLPRSDVISLQKKGLWAQGLAAPFDEVRYSDWPIGQG